MERLAKQLKHEEETLEQLKAEVNSMEHDLMQRRLRRVSCTTSIPTVSGLLGCVARKQHGDAGCPGCLFLSSVSSGQGFFFVKQWMKDCYLQ